MTFETQSSELAGAQPDEGSETHASHCAHVVYIPDRAAPRFFVWGRAESNSLCALGIAAREHLLDEAMQIRPVDGIAVPLLSALPQLASVSANELSALTPSHAVWSLAAKLALDLVARERVAPRIVQAGRNGEARSVVVLSLREDYERFAALSKAFPLGAHAVPIAKSASRNAATRRTLRVWAADGLLRHFLDSAADALVRASAESDTGAGSAWAHRLLRALSSEDAGFAAEGFQERSLLDELDGWVRPLLGSDVGAPRACFRLEAPPGIDRAATAPTFYLRYLLQAATDSNAIATASDVYAGKRKPLANIRSSARVAEESLLQALNVAARIFEPIERSLHTPRPEGVELTPDAAWQFLSAAGPALSNAGMGVMVPEEMQLNGDRRLRMRMRIGAGKSADAHESLSMRESLSYVWEARLGEQALSLRQLKEIGALKAPLVRYRGRWIAVNRRELDHASQLLAEGGGMMTATAALAAALGQTAESEAPLPIEVAVEGKMERLLAQLREPALPTLPAPTDFHGQLRPYQERGLAWLVQMSQLGLGACLADDMGLGKTIQLLAFLLHRRVQQKDDTRPVLLVCPTSVIGNWQRELSRFAPTIPVVQHYGAERLREPEAFVALESGTVVITSYGLLRRDARVLAAVDWSVAVLDEAQNIKNSESRTARVARSLPADFRVALTGTPMENRLTELWSIFEFLNPGLLGPLATFQREVALPIERFGRNDIAERLRRIVRPLLLRRVKSDPAVIQDLPSKHENEVFCTLTSEQASLYRSAVDMALSTIETAEGIERRGHVLALITALKQICNHPAQYLHEAGPLPQRSGKLQRLTEMLEELVANNERALVFTQYREMGDRLVRELKRALGVEVLFLHGGTPRPQREQLVKRFQEGGATPRIFVLSVKAGGTGLNLTAAAHVFHYDRWWNPAVEDQATDRAYRIGQSRHVQVHKFLCAGTIEEKIDSLLRSKRDLASRIVGHGEQWITELGNAELRELFALSANAVVDGESTNGENELEAA